MKHAAGNEPRGLRRPGRKRLVTRALGGFVIFCLWILRRK
jgi:hypothetical protein